MSIQWFPGHMAKARRLISEQLKTVDVIIELRDARLPKASENPLLAQLAINKPKVYVFTKKDLADPAANIAWEAFFNEQDIPVLFVNVLKDSLHKPILQACQIAASAKLEKDKRKGLKPRPIKAMVLGIPNVGKSTFINALAKKKVVQVANRPGVTKAVQWLHVSDQLYLLDTPGVLWPKFEDQLIGAKLALSNAIKEQILPLDTVLMVGLEYLFTHYKSALQKRYDIQTKEYDFAKLCQEIGVNKHLLTKNQEVDINRVYQFIFTDIKQQKLGRISWEWPND